MVESKLCQVHISANVKKSVRPSPPEIERIGQSRHGHCTDSKQGVL